MSTRFKASRANLLRYDYLLFTKNKLPGIDGTLYDALPENERQTIFDMLGELYVIVSTYAATSQRYESERSKFPRTVDLDHLNESRDATLMASASLKHQEQAKAVGWMKKTWWTIWEKKSIEKLVRDFEKWIKRLRNFIRLVWGPSPFLNSLSQLQHLEKDQDAAQVSLLDVPLRKLVMAPVGYPMINVGVLRTMTSAVFAGTSHQRYGQMGNANVFVEHKPYEVNEVNVINDVAFNQIGRLIALLHKTKNENFQSPPLYQIFRRDHS